MLHVNTRPYTIMPPLRLLIGLSSIYITAGWKAQQPLHVSNPLECLQVKVYNESGYLWENYDDDTGHGKGSHPFTGWTALLVLVAGQAY